MSDTGRWEKRARELLPEMEVKEGSGYVYSYSPVMAQRLAIQLGREMADARAEEIAKAIEKREAIALPASMEWTLGNISRTAFLKSAEIARSFLSKPESTLEKLTGMPRDMTLERGWPKPEAEAAIRADERERIAKEIEWDELLMPNTTRERLARFVRAPAVPPKTREAVLEEALREIASGHVAGTDQLQVIAERALDWKP